MKDRPKIVLVNRCFIYNDKNQMLLIRRSSEQATNVGLWEAPGGKLESGQDVSHALEREVMEETGLLVEPTSRLFFVESFIISQPEKYRGLPYIALFGEARVAGGKLKLSIEHDKSVWLTPEQALDYDLSPETRKALIVLTPENKRD